MNHTQRRKELIKKLSQDSLAILTANSQMQRGVDSVYKFEQEANFLYVTGIGAPDWLLVIDVDSKKEWLVSPDVGETRQIFDGSLSHEEAARASGIKNILDAKAGELKIKKMLAEKNNIYTLKSLPNKFQDFYTNPAGRNLKTKFKLKNTKDIRPILANLRAIKSPEEVEAIKAAIGVTVAGFKSVEKSLKKCKTEFEVEAILNYGFKNQNADHAYDHIVAAGKNACTLHYIKNSSKLAGNRWLLIDSGARKNGYCADITRTYALNPTKRDKQIYDAVKRVHDFAVSLLKPNQNTKEYLELVEKAMGEELIKLGLIKKSQSAEIRKYFPHGIGHGLGIDVHDSLGAPKQFKVGMILTVEPGIYIPEEQIGIRIENDILITQSGPINLSADLPY